MHKIINLTNSPFDLQAVGGKVVLPAFGDVTAEFEPGYLDLLRAARTVDVKPAGNADPLDHDGDGKKGGSKSADGDKDELARLRADYQEIVGKRPFNGWDTDELQRRIDEALAS